MERFKAALLEMNESAEEIEDKTEMLLPALDVANRWSSLYLMIDRALVLRRTIDYTATIEEELRDHEMTFHEWECVSEVLEFLHPFAEITKHIEGEKCATLGSVVPLYNSLIDFVQDWDMKEGHTLETKRAAQAALRKLKEYYNRLTPVYIISTVMDPRLKLDYFLRNGFSEGSVQSNGENLIDTRIKPP